VATTGSVQLIELLSAYAALLLNGVITETCSKLSARENEDVTVTRGFGGGVTPS
jgi:hypothetical protein